MEQMGQNVGYTLYRSRRNAISSKEKIRIVDGFDRAHIYIDGKLISTQYQQTLGEIVEFEVENKEYQIDILMENLGRVNYGQKLLAASQNKGINTGVMIDIHFINNWNQYPLQDVDAEKINFDKEWIPNQPSFYLYEFEIDSLKDTFLDVSDFGKGFVIVNGMNIGRFWDVGPYFTLYIPKGILEIGTNKIIIFETEGRYNDSINLCKKPIIK